MEGVSTKVYSGIKTYWRRKGYQRLNGTGRRRKLPVVKLAEGSKRRRFWRINLSKKLKLKIRFKPKKFFIGLRDAYVNMMMKLANSRMIGGYGAGGYTGNGVEGFGKKPIKEYDERMIVEIYKSIVLAQGQLAPRDAAWVSSGITCNKLVTTSS